MEGRERGKDREGRMRKYRGLLLRKMGGEVRSGRVRKGRRERGRKEGKGKGGREREGRGKKEWPDL